MASSRIVNLTELADLLDMSRPTLRDLIKDNADFPVEMRGDHGVPYEFDAGKVQAWRIEHRAAIAAAEAERADDLEQMRLELFGGVVEDDTTLGMAPTERRAEIEAQLAADKMRRQRGELVEVAALDQILRVALAELQKGLRQIGPEVARDHGLAREVRIAIDNAVRNRTNALVERLQPVLAAEGERDAA